MHPELAKRFEALEKRRIALVKRVKALPAATQAAKRSPAEFSPAEVIMHLAITEHGNVVFLKKTPPVSLKGKSVKTTFFFKMTVEKMRNPTNPLPTLPVMVPKGPVDVDVAAQSWEAARDQVKEYLEQAETPGAAFIKFHFIFGVASASDLLDLLEAHMTYHEQRFPA